MKLVEVHTTEEERAEFLSQSDNLNTFMDCVTAFSRVLQQNNSRSTSLKAARWTKPLFKTFKMATARAQGVNITNTPGGAAVSSLVLGAIMSALSVSGDYVEYQAKIEATISNMATKLEFLDEYNGSLYPKDKNLRKSLMAVYASILNFTVQSYRLFVNEKGHKKTAASRIAKSAWDTFQDKMGSFQEDFDQRLENFQLAVGACRDKELIKLGRERHNDMEAVTSGITRLETKLNSNISLMEQQKAQERLETRSK